MGKDRNGAKGILTLALLVSLVFLAACAEVQLNRTAVPPPPPTAKLRVFIQMVSGYSPHGWKTPHEEYARLNLQRIEKYWQETGIYEVIAEREVNLVLGNQSRSLNWSWKGWNLAKQVGRALHADYAMISERSSSGGEYYWITALVNVETGKEYKFSTGIKGGRAEDYGPVIQESYAKVFHDAKNDLLATAIRKGRQAAPEIPGQQASASNRKPAPAATALNEPRKPMLPTSPPAAPADPAPPQVSPPGPVASSKPMPPKDPIPSEAFGREAVSEKAVPAGLRPGARQRLAVYDLEAAESHRVVALILSEALRQELFKLGLFQMVNRENIAKVLEEMSLQQTGLVNESEAVKAGKGLAAHQIILGRFGTLGKMSILQVKRLDLETQGDLGFGSLKCNAGREEELLQQMEGLARELAGKK